MIRKLFFFIWFSLIVFFSLTPSSMGYQFVSSKIALTQSGFFHHVFGYFVLGVMSFYTFEKKRIWMYLLGFFILSALFEVIQYQIPSRAFNVYDLLGNGLGLLGVVPVVWGQACVGSGLRYCRYWVVKNFR
jgi:glycopeptide antibiotics resistance protein